MAEEEKKGFFRRVGRTLRGTGSATAGARRAAGRGARTGAGGVAAGVGAVRGAIKKVRSIYYYFILVGVGVLDITLKRFFGYDQTLSLVLSGFWLLIFWWVTFKDWGKTTAVISVFLIDIMIGQLPRLGIGQYDFLQYFGAIRIFLWLGLGLILVFWDIGDYVRAKEEIPLPAKIVFFLVILLALLIVFPDIKDMVQKNSQDYWQEFGVLEEIKEEAEVRAKESVSALSEVYYRIYCSLNQPAKIEECVKQKIAEARCKPYLEAGQQENYEECIKVETGLTTEVEGIVDPVMNEPLKIEWKRGEEFAQREIFIPGTPAFSSTLEINNPRRDELDLRLSCQFSEMVGNGNISGLVYSTLGESFTVEAASREIEVICSPQEALESDKKYRVTYRAELVDFSTVSKLQTLFIGGDKEEETEKVIKSGYPLAGRSRAPKDLARMNIKMGQEGVIKDEEIVQLGVSIENIGGGEITDVKKAQVNLNPPGIKSTDLAKSQPCSLEGDKALSISSQVILSQKAKKTILGGVCFLRLGNDLKYPEEFVKVVEFQGDLIYSYTVEEGFITPQIRIVGGEI